MAISKEAIERIINFSPEEEVARKKMEVDLGKIDEDARLVYGIFSYPLRAISLPGQPRVLGWTEQPTLALVGENGAKPIPYATDIVALGEDLVRKIADLVADS